MNLLTLALASPCGSEPLLANLGRSHFKHSAAGAASHIKAAKRQIFRWYF
jgi:hypothetical protein